MRKITEEAARALHMGESFKSANTIVENGNVMQLFGNTIAIHDNEANMLTIRDSGWKSATTKERLNGILTEFGSKWRIYQLGGKWFITDGMGIKKEWNGFLVVEDI